MRSVIRRTFAIVVCILATASGTKPTAAQAGGSGVAPGILRPAFLLGFNYGSAHVVLSRQPTLPESARDGYDSLMRDVTGFARQLSVTIDTTQQKVSGGTDSVQVEILSRGRRIVDLTAITLAGKHGRPAAAAVTLGYLAAVGIEYVPRLDSVARADVETNYRSLASEMGLPVELASAYARDLGRAADRENAVAVMLHFKSEVVAHFERMDLRTASGAQRQFEVWQMGWNLAVAALAQGRGAKPELITPRFDQARAYAGVLDVRIPALPEAGTGTARDTATAISYLLHDIGERVPDQLGNQYGPQAAALFELALRAPLAMVLYGSGDQSMDETMTTTLDRAARKAGLPSEIYMPLVGKMAARASSQVVTPEITRMSDAIRAYFTNLAKR